MSPGGSWISTGIHLLVVMVMMTDHGDHDPDGGGSMGMVNNLFFTFYIYKTLEHSLSLVNH